jgi:hypothetical protein
VEKAGDVEDGRSSWLLDMLRPSFLHAMDRIPLDEDGRDVATDKIEDNDKIIQVKNDKSNWHDLRDLSFLTARIKDETRQDRTRKRKEKTRQDRSDQAQTI